MFHRVLPQAELNDYYDSERVVTAESFVSLILFLRAWFEFVSLGELTERLRQPALNHPLCCITFDDGWEDNYRCAWPVLQREHVPATIFLTTDYIDRDELLWHDGFHRLTAKLSPEHRRELNGDLKERHGWIDPSMDATALPQMRQRLAKFATTEREQLASALIDDLRHTLPQAAASLPSRAFLHSNEILTMLQGGIDFGAHTVSHPLLTRIGDDQLTRELAGARQILEDRFKRPMTTMAYPFGNYDRRVIEGTARAGYIVGATSDPHPTPCGVDPLVLPRVGICEAMLSREPGQFDPSLFMLHMSAMLWRTWARAE
jgi:peptidoglycan/xylan/chitin deacetylase (PgdA/CDA1 family)